MATLLVVDDNTEFGFIVAEFLRYKGYESVEVVRSAEQALEILQSHAIDVVIADLHLAGKRSGIDILARHKSLYPNGCRILLTAAISDMVRSVCAYVDAVCLEKPFPLQELVDRIEKVIHS